MHTWSQRGITATSGATQLSHPLDPTPAASACPARPVHPVSPVHHLHQNSTSPARGWRAGRQGGRSCPLKGPSRCPEATSWGRRGLQRLPQHSGKAATPRFQDPRPVPSESSDTRTLGHSQLGLSVHPRSPADTGAIPPSAPGSPASISWDQLRSQAKARPLAPGTLRELAHYDSDLPENSEAGLFKQLALCFPPSPAGWILETHCRKIAERSR